MQRAIHTFKGDNSIFFPELCHFFDLDFLSSIKHLTGERWHPHAVLLFRLQITYVLTHYQTTNFRLFQTEFDDDNFKFD